MFSYSYNVDVTLSTINSVAKTFFIFYFHVQREVPLTNFTFLDFSLVFAVVNISTDLKN